MSELLRAHIRNRQLRERIAAIQDPTEAIRKEKAEALQTAAERLAVKITGHPLLQRHWTMLQIRILIQRGVYSFVLPGSNDVDRKRVSDLILAFEDLPGLWNNEVTATHEETDTLTLTVRIVHPSDQRIHL